MRITTKAQYRAYAFGIKEELESVMKEDRQSRLFLLRLTIKNVKGDNLSASLSHLNESFPRFLQISGLKKLIIAYIRGILNSYNKEREDYHVYIESLILLPSSYFDNKFSNEQLAEFWQQALRIPYTPIVSLVAVRQGDKENYISACLAEVERLLNHLDQNKLYSDNIQQQALASRKLLTFGGKLKQ